MDFTEIDKAEEWFNNSEHGKGKIAGFVPLLMAEYAEYYYQSKVKNLDVSNSVCPVLNAQDLINECARKKLARKQNNAMAKGNFKVECPFCKRENDFSDNNWHDELVDDFDTSIINCMHCDFSMEITIHAIYTLSAKPYDHTEHEEWAVVSGQANALQHTNKHKEV